MPNGIPRSMPVIVADGRTIRFDHSGKDTDPYFQVFVDKQLVAEGIQGMAWSVPFALALAEEAQALGRALDVGEAEAVCLDETRLAAQPDPANLYLVQADWYDPNGVFADRDILVVAADTLQEAEQIAREGSEAAHRAARLPAMTLEISVRETRPLQGARKAEETPDEAPSAPTP